MTGKTWPIPCSPNQMMVMRLKQQGYVANVPFLLRARGPLDYDILREALQRVIERHEILRSAYASVGASLFMQAPTSCRVELTVRNVTDESSPIASARRDCAAECRAPFAHDAAPRLRLSVFRLAADDHLIALIVDHLAADGLSLGVLGAEWRAFYLSIEAAIPVPVQPLVPQYRTFMQDQAAWLTGGEAEEQRRWWVGQLRGFRGGTVAEAAAGVRSATAVEFVFGTGVSRRVSTLCTRYRLTPFMAVLSAYALSLCGLDGERDLLIATVRANRRESATRTTIGHLANLIPLRIALDQTCDGDALLRMVGPLCRTAYAHDQLPFRDIAELARRELGVSPVALARYAINFVPFPAAAEHWASHLRVSQQWGLLDRHPLTTGRISLFVRQSGMRMAGTLIVDPSAVPPAWAASFESRLANILLRLAVAPRTSLSELVSAAART